MTQAAHPSVHGGDDPDPCRAEATGVSDDQRSCSGPPLAVRVRPSGGARCKTVRIGMPRTRESVASMTAGTVLFLFHYVPDVIGAVIVAVAAVVVGDWRIAREAGPVGPGAIQMNAP